MLFQVLISLAGLEIAPANHAKYTVFHNLGVSEEVSCLVVEVVIEVQLRPLVVGWGDCHRRHHILRVVLRVMSCVGSKGGHRRALHIVGLV